MPADNDEKWNYELIKSWMLGLEINQDYYGRYPARFSQWGAAKRVAFCALLALAFAAAFAFLTLRRGCRHSPDAGSRPLNPDGFGCLFNLPLAVSLSCSSRDVCRPVDVQQP